MDDEGKSNEVIKLVNVNSKTNEFSVTPEATKFLESFGEEDNFNIIFIFGNARSGKSFLMNQIITGAGGNGKFKVMNQAQPCTKGIDLSRFVIDQREFGSDGDTPQDIEGAKTRLAFVDVEGQGADQDEKYDTLLALPLLLTSKVVIFNHKGAPTVHAMLSRIGVLARAAEWVTTMAEQEGKDDTEDADEDDEMEKPKKFGHLHVVFRDFSFRGTSESVRNQLLNEENVPKKGLKDDPGLTNQIQAINERNDIRGLLKDNFESISVNLFKQPADPDQLKEHAELPQELIDVEFLNEIEVLREDIVQQTQEPRQFNGVTLTGSRLAAILPKVIDIVNKGVDINVPTLFRAMEQEAVQRTVKTSLTEFEKVLAEFKLPLSVAKFNKQAEEAKVTVMEFYDKKLKTCILEDEKTQGKEDFNKKSVHIIEVASKKNTDAAWKFASNLVLKEVTELKSAYQKWCAERIPSKDTSIFQNRYHEMQLEAAKNLAGHLKEFPTILGDPKFAKLMQVEQERVDVVVQIQEAKNKAALNADRLKQLIAERDAERKKHLEQQDLLLKKISDENERTVKEKERIKSETDNAFSTKINAATAHHKKRESKLIERAEELLEIKRQNVKKIENLNQQLTTKEAGYLEKQGHHNKKYKVRWFQITKTGKIAHLRYFGKQSDTSPKGAIVLDRHISVEYAGKGNDFIVHTSKRDYNLRAAHEKEAQAWVASLNSHIKDAK